MVSRETRGAALVAFAKDPSRVAVKTRLACTVGAQLATRVYEALLRDCLKSLCSIPSATTYLACYPDEESQFFQNFKKSFDLKLIRQTGQNLGDRMLSCAGSLLEEHTAVIIFGTDVPCLPVSSIDSALKQMHYWNVLLGPCGDGGYYAFGVNRIIESMLDAVQWGTESVFVKTVKNCVELGLEVSFLDVLDDIDDERALSKLCQKLQLQNDETSAISLLLEEEGLLVGSRQAKRR